jgi:hypothetical protein|tara:strand:- start:1466 stop:1693 length:228 start_codon:yes stop_codon:yes gene_type:complete
MSEQFISEFFGLVKKSKPKHVEVCINKKQKDGRIDQLGFYNTTSKEYVIYEVKNLTRSSMKEFRNFLKVGDKNET